MMICCQVRTQKHLEHYKLRLDKAAGEVVEFVEEVVGTRNCWESATPIVTQVIEAAALTT